MCFKHRAPVRGQYRDEKSTIDDPEPASCYIFNMGFWSTTGKNVKHRAPQASSGFTLLEVMMIVVIMGIAAAIALPSVSNTIRKARSEAEARRYKNVLTYARYLARSSLRCTLVQVKRNNSAATNKGWEAKVWSYDSCHPPASSYPIHGGRSPYTGEKLEKLVYFNAALVDFPDSDKLAVLDSKYDSGKDIILLFNRDGGLAPLAENTSYIATKTFRVRCIHEHYGRMFKYAIYPVTGSVRLCEAIDRDSVCN